MNNSPSISNYENLGLFLTSNPTSKSASEKNGRCIRRSFRKPTVVVPQWQVEECSIVLRNQDGSTKEVSGFTVCKGTVVKRFITKESVDRFISKN